MFLVHCSVGVPERIERGRNALGHSYPAHVNRFLTLRKLVESKRQWPRRGSSSTSRSGLYGTNEVRKVHRRWLRGNAWLLTCSAGVIALMFGLILLLLPPWLRGFMAGVFTTTLVANIAYMMVVGTGTVPRLAGIEAEKSMARDLRSLERTGLTDADPIDVLVHLAWNQPLATRKDRARRVTKEHASFFEAYQPAAREVLALLLDKYAEQGIGQLDDLEVLQVQPLKMLGTPAEIAARFGSADALRDTIAQLGDLLYVA